MTSRVCMVCEKEFLVEERKIFIPLERPYMNVIVHRDCFGIATEEWITENIEKLMKLYNKK